MKKVFLAILFVSLLSCENQNKPDLLISRDQMVDLMYDLTVYNSLQSYNSNNDTMYIYHKRSDILEKYQLDSISYEEQHEFYRSDVEDYAKIHKEVNERILAKIEEVKKEPNDKDDDIVEKISSKRKMKLNNFAKISTTDVASDQK